MRFDEQVEFGDTNSWEKVTYQIPNANVMQS